jgi:hypothetical protein
MHTKIRKLNENDLPFLKDTLYYQNDKAHPYHNKFFSKLFTHIIKNLMQSTDGLIICDTQDENTIYSFILFNKYQITETDNFTVIHYIYTKQQFRKFGLASQLLKQVNDDKQIILHTFKTTYKNEKYKLVYLPDYKHIGEIKL